MKLSRLSLSVLAATGAASVLLTAFAASSPRQGTSEPKQQPPQQKRERTDARSAVPGITRQPSAAAAGALLDPADSVLLLLDHQTGLFQTVGDIPIRDLRSNVEVLAKCAELAKVPVLLTASEPDGPNGPLMPELRKAAPSAKYIPRKGEISAWDNADFVAAVEATGRKTLVIAGVWTSVCVAFPALQAKADGYEVYFVTDASGDPSEMTFHTTLARMTSEGIVPVTTNVVMCELQRTWSRSDAQQWAALYSEYAPKYRAAAESHESARQGAQKVREASAPVEEKNGK